METKVCTRCKEEKSVSEFYKNKNSKDGVSWYCKTCIRQPSINPRTYKKEFKVEAINGGKVCTLCNIEKPLEDFGKKVNTKDGFSFWCRECKKIKDKIFRDKNHEKRLSSTRQKEEIQEKIRQEKIKATKKVCRVCNQLLDKICFSKAQSNVDGYANICKPCAVIKTRKYVEQNKDKVIAWKKNHYQENRVELLLRQKQYRIKNRDKITEGKKRYYLATRERNLARSRNWRLANLEHVKNQKRIYRLNNIEKIKENKRKYYQGHLFNPITKTWEFSKQNYERILKNKSEYYYQNKDKILNYEKLKRQIRKEEYKKKRHLNYIRHKDTHYKTHILWKKNNPEKVKLFAQNHRAKKLGNGGKHTLEEWLALKTKYKNTCLRCGKREPQIKLTKDHVFPIKWGGSNNINNIQPLCFNCNCQKNRKYIDYRPDSPTYGEGWKKPSLWA